MFEYDAILIDDESCPVESVSIMQSNETDEFALVQNPRVDPAVLREAEEVMRREELVQKLIPEIELKVFMLMQNLDTEEGIGAAWAAVTSTVNQSARNRIKEIGGDVDKVMQALDGFFLENPNLT